MYMESQLNVITFAFLCREYEDNFTVCYTGAESQVISAFMYSYISLELFAASVGAYGLSLSEYDITQHCMSHVLQVK